ncbi:hypothetical protein BO85DRAFT_484501 [Aspergillus piperis CBS 112811]|uniref:Uncharacterized protein n=1 Tax=Aspergillus piperis CBS 112811 TaxID=1448313 RepID=A0A8G1R9D0_9EURO|nr:hypothetical protein BO85DRAFT_484501 [Aspergillus piperis CBS 112811]RAH62501.1 hypothetical protein BO85DRAFT_484501 [Aspergillus piperis CBS 112811]
MDRSATSGNNGSGRATNGTHSDLPDLATYQAQWAKIHDDTVRQINEALGQMQTRLLANDWTVWPASSAASRSARGLFPVWAASWGFGERWILATVAVKFVGDSSQLFRFSFMCGNGTCLITGSEKAIALVAQVEEEGQCTAVYALEEPRDVLPILSELNLILGYARCRRWG